MIDSRIEVAEALIVVAQAAIAFIEQVLVDAALLIDGDEVFDALGVDACAVHLDAHHRPAIGGKLIVDGLRGMVVDRGFELDLGLKAILFLIGAEHAIERAIYGVVIDVRDLPEMRVEAELVDGHAGIACDRDLTDTRTRSRDHAKRDVGKLFLGTWGDGLRDDRFVVAVLLQRGAHLLDGADHLFLRQAGSRIQLAGPLQLHIHGGANGAVYADGPDKRARSPGENQSHAIRLTRAAHLNGVVEAGGIELAQTALQIVLGQRRSFGLGQMAGKRLELIGGDAFERDAAHRKALPPENGVRRWRGSIRGPGNCRVLCGAGCGRLAPTVARPASCSQKEGGEQNCAARQAIGQTLRVKGIWTERDRTKPALGGRASTASFYRLCPQDHILENVRGNRLPNQGQGVHHAMLQGIGWSRFLTMSVNPRCFTLY